MNPNEFMTYSGIIADVMSPKPEMISITDIARALARSQRFGGHAHIPCSVAEHSVLVSRLCSPEHALQGLLHDASEAYCQDIITNLKRNLKPLYGPIETRWMAAICEALNVPDLVDLPADVHHADAVALQIERRDCFSPSRVSPTGPQPEARYRALGLDTPRAYATFMARWHELRSVVSSAA